GLRDGRQIYANGELISDITQYRPFQGGINELAKLYDAQHSPAYKDTLTYTSPTTGEPVSVSFLLAKTQEEIEQRLRNDRLRAELTNGMMGRLPDFMSAFITGMAFIRGLL